MPSAKEAGYRAVALVFVGFTLAGCVAPERRADPPGPGSQPNFVVDEVFRFPPNATWVRLSFWCACEFRYEVTPAADAWFPTSAMLFYLSALFKDDSLSVSSGLDRYLSAAQAADSLIYDQRSENATHRNVAITDFSRGGAGHSGNTTTIFFAVFDSDERQIEIRLRATERGIKTETASGNHQSILTSSALRERVEASAVSMDLERPALIILFSSIGPHDPQFEDDFDYVFSQGESTVKFHRRDMGFYEVTRHPFHAPYPFHLAGNGVLNISFEAAAPAEGPEYPTIVSLLGDGATVPPRKA